MPNIEIATKNNMTFKIKLWKDIQRNWSLYLMVIPVVVFYLIFHYAPMYGAIIAFKDFSPAKGIIASKWIGWENFISFFSSQYCFRIIKNTVTISLYSIVFGFPAPIIFALLMNELKNKLFTKTVQTITYLPHFISLVVICGLIKDFTAEKGIINDILQLFGGTPANMLNIPSMFPSIYVLSGIWQEVGWGSIIYLAALAGIDQELYEAAWLDGAGRWQQTLHITLPGIMPTIVTLLILRMGSVMNVGYEKIILLYNPMTYETADVISSFVYRAGLQELKYGYSTAVGLFNSVINFFFVFTANKISQKINSTSIW